MRLEVHDLRAGCRGELVVWRRTSRGGIGTRQEKRAVAPRSRCTRWGSSVSTSRKERRAEGLAAAAADDPEGAQRAASCDPSARPLHRPVRVGRRPGPRVRCATRRSLMPVARAHQRLGDRRHGVHEAGTRVPWRATAVRRVGRQGRQLPDRREPDGSTRRPACRSTCSSTCPSRGRATAPAATGRRDPPATSDSARQWRIALEMMEHAVENGTAQGGRARGCRLWQRRRVPRRSSGGSTSNMRSESTVPTRS